MRKHYLLISALCLCLFMVALPALAAGSSGLYGLVQTGTAAKYNTGQSIFNIVTLVVRAVLGLLVIAFFMFTFYAGLRWMTARGNEEFVTRAKDTLTSAITGLIIVASSFALVNFILSKLGN